MSDPTLDAGGLTAGVHQRTLDNGLTVLVKEDHDQPVVAIVTYVKAGYFHETDDVSGIAHVVEHMFFNGTPTRPDPEDISRQTKAFGGSLNAGTIYDRTSYYVVLPSERWAEGLAIQADAYQNPLFDGDVLEKELEAILQEARRKLDSPTSFAREQMFELAFSKHRMRRWRMGPEEVLRAMDPETLRRWYDDHYRPANTILSIVGDVDADAVFAEVEALYGQQPRGELRKKGGPDEPRQREFRYERISGDVTQAYTFLGFHTPGVDHEDNPALDVLATVLSSGRSSRLERRMKEELGLVTSVSASAFQFEDIGLFEIDAVLSPNDLDRAVRETFVELERIKQFGVTEQELARARGMLESAEAMSQEEVLGQASTLARYQALGDYRKADEELAALRAVTSEDIQRVAREYLTISNANLLEYTPAWAFEKKEPAELAGHIQGAVLAAAASMQPETELEFGESVLPRQELETWSERFESTPGDTEEVRRFDLPHGGVLVVKERRSAPTVATGAYFRGGRLDEPPSLNGITRMMQRTMVKETERRTAPQLASEIEALGTGIGRMSHDDFFGFQMATLRRDFPAAFDVLFDVLHAPKFTEEGLEREQEAQLSAIQSIEDRSGALAGQFLRDALYNEHPYGRPELGTPALIRTVGPARLAQHHREVVHPENMVLCVVGDVDADQVHTLVSTYLADWNPAAATERFPDTPEAFYHKDRVQRVAPLRAVREGRMAKPRAQSAIFIAFPTVDRLHADSYPLEVLQSVTGGLGGTFFEEIRTRRGLAYQVATFDAGRALAGHFGTFVACSPENTDEVQDLVLEMMNGLALEAPAAADVDRARNYLAGSYVVGSQTNRSQMGQLAGLEVYGQDLAEFDAYPDRIRAVTRDDLVRVAQTYFLDKPYAIGAVDGEAGNDANPD